MALFGTQRDVSLIRYLNRELMWDIISQECAYYQFNYGDTKVNMYGESTGAKYYRDPVLLNTLVERGDATSPIDDFGVNTSDGGVNRCKVTERDAQRFVAVVSQSG